MSQLSVADQHEVDSLNDDIRRLTQENKEAFSTRMRLEAEKNKLENLLTNNLMRRKDELMQVQYRTCSFFYRLYVILLPVVYSVQSSQCVTYIMKLIVYRRYPSILPFILGTVLTMCM